MSKTKRNKIDSWEDEEDNYRLSDKQNKKKERRIERALKTKDISIFFEDDGEY